MDSLKITDTLLDTFCGVANLYFEKAKESQANYRHPSGKALLNLALNTYDDPGKANLVLKYMEFRDFVAISVDEYININGSEYLGVMGLDIDQVPAFEAWRKTYDPSREQYESELNRLEISPASIPNYPAEYFRQLIEYVPVLLNDYQVALNEIADYNASVYNTPWNNGNADFDDYKPGIKR